MRASRLLLASLAVIAFEVTPVCAGLIGGNNLVTGSGAFPDVAYNSVNSNYLVVWYTGPTWGRLVDNNGNPIGSIFQISSSAGGLFPAVAYNATNNEFLVTWDDQRAVPFPIWGQRVRGSDGALLGGNFQISSNGLGRSAVAWSSTSNSYLVIAFDWSEVWGQRVSNTGTLLGGTFNISNDAAFSGYPGVTYGSSGNQYLVSWDHDDGRIVGRRVDASNGNLLGGMFTILNGYADRSAGAYDTVNNRWMVEANYHNPVSSYDQRAQLVSTSGTLIGGAVDFTTTNEYEGDSQFGGDICYIPGMNRFAVNTANSGYYEGQSLIEYNNATGAVISFKNILGVGNFPSSNVAADTALNRYLSAWMIAGGGIGVQLYEASSTTAPGQASAPNPVNGAPGHNINADLSWTAGSGATSRNIYFGTTNPPLIATTISGTTYDPGTLAWDTTYYWQVNEVNNGGTRQGPIWSFGTKSIVSVNLGNTNIEDMMTSPIGGDGDTIGATNIGGHECRRNMDPGANDFYFYFTVNDAWAFQGSKTDLWVAIEYYDNASTGSIGFNYDATSSAYKDGGSIALTGTNTWKTQKFHITDAYFGNRENVGGDFRFYVGNVVRYLDNCNVQQKTPGTIPPGQASSPSPANGSTTVGKNDDLSWTAGSGASSHNVYFGTTNPPPLVGTQTTTTFDPGTMTPGTTYYWRIDEYTNGGGTTTGNVWSFTVRTYVSIDLGASNVQNGMSNPIGGDGDTTGATIGGRDCRKNMDPGANDHYFYFTVDNSYSYQGNNPDQWISIEYYDNAPNTNLDLNYDATDGNAYKGGGSILLTGTNTWKKHTWHVTDAYFGNRENNGGDFRISAGATARYLDVVTVSNTAPSPALPGQASSPSPANAATGVSVSATLSWTAGSSAASHNVYFGTTNPPPLIGNQAGATYNPGTMTDGITYFWRIDEVNATGTTTGVVWNFATQASSLTTFSNSTFTSSADSWTISVWKAGALADGTMAWDSGTGNPAGGMKSTGAGITNNSDSCTREGGEIKKLISTAGYNTIQVKYDLRFSTDQTGTTTTGSCTANLLEGNCADKVAVYYSTAGTGGPWTLLETVNASSVTQGTFSTRTLNLAAGASDQANFALRLKFQFNTDSDSAWLDNIKVAGAALPPPGQASNPNPTTAATGVSINADLTWTAGSGAASHDVRFGTVNPPPFVVNQAGTTYDPGAMSAGTTYYWRIDEKNGSGTTTGTVWSFTTLALPGAASAPTPASGATQVSISPSLSWTAGSNAMSHDVRFGTVNPPPFVINQAATTYNPGTLSAGTTYYWRIDEKNGSGTTNGTVWSFTTLPLPGAASAPTPAHAATAVNINADLSWTAGSNAVSHNVNFGTSDPPDSIGNQAGTTYDPGTLNPNTTYYWRIDEVNGSGTTTGTVWSFSTLPLAGAASAPTPADGATQININADLSWTAGSNATSHDVRFGTNPPALIGNQAGTTYDPGTTSPNTTYYWRIDEVNSSGTTTGTVWSYTTLPLPGAASTPNPADSATLVDINTDLSWTAGSNAASHDVRFGTTNPPPSIGSQAGTTYDPGTMSAGTTYYWRIDEVNTSGTTTGTVWSFTTLALPGLATTPSPANAATGVSINADLSWTAGSNTTSHDVRFGTVNPPPFVVNQAGATYDPGTLSAGVTYYWRIDEKNGSGTTTGTVWSFTTLPLPGAASGPSPSNGATLVSILADLAWTAGSNAASHDVRFGTVNPPPFVVNQAGTAYDPGILSINTIYYWRIDEVNGSGTTTGTVWSFSTLPLPGLASAPSPVNGATAQNINVDLAWTAGSNATSHDVRFGTNNPPPFVQNQAGTTYDPGTLSASTTYYWRIDEVNGSGTTTGTVWSLTTAGTPPAAPTVTAPTNGSTVTSLTPTITWTGAAHDGYQVRISQQNDSNTSTNGWDSGDVTNTGNSAVSGTLRNYSFYYVFVRLRNSGGWGAWSAAGYNFIVNTNATNGTVYLGNALPSASGWEVYDGTCENGCSGITSTIVSDGGSNVWQLIDAHTSNRAKLSYTNSGSMNIDFTTGASVASRMRATSIGGTPTYNLGISNGNVGGHFLRLYTNEVRLVDINGTNRGSYALDATVYHKYQLTVKNATAGNNTTAAWKVYVDGTLQISFTGAGTDNGFDGFMSGHAGTGATGTWWFDNIGGRNDGEFTPAQWDPVY